MITDLQPWHLEAIRPQKAQTGLVGNAGDFVRSGYAAMDNGAPVACAGLIRADGHTIAWAILADMGPGAFLRFHRAVKRFLDRQNEVIWAFVSSEFPQGCRWIRLLGFKPVKEIQGYILYEKSHV